MKKSVVLIFALVCMAGAGIAQMTLYRPKGPSEIYCTMNNGPHYFEEFIQEFYTWPLVNQNKDAVHFIFLFNEASKDTLDDIKILRNALTSELKKEENAQNQIIRELDFPSMWWIQKIPDQYIIRDFKHHLGEDISYYAGHHTVWIISQNNAYLNIVKKRIFDATKNTDVHVLREYEFSKNGQKAIQFVIEKKDLGIGCVIDESKVLVNQTMRVFNYQDIIKKKTEIPNEPIEGSSVDSDVNTDISIADHDSSKRVHNDGIMNGSVDKKWNLDANWWWSEELSNYSIKLRRPISLNNDRFLLGLTFGQGMNRYVSNTKYWVTSSGMKRTIYRNIIENGWIQYNQFGADGSYRWFQIDHVLSSDEIDINGFLDISLGCLKITRKEYFWSSGSKDVRGYWPGLQDELTNIPELGFVDNVSVAGQSGDLSIANVSLYQNIGMRLEFAYKNLTSNLGAGYMRASFRNIEQETIANLPGEFGFGGIVNNIDIQKTYFQIGIGVKF